MQGSYQNIFTENYIFVSKNLEFSLRAGPVEFTMAAMAAPTTPAIKSAQARPAPGDHDFERERSDALRDPRSWLSQWLSRQSDQRQAVHMLGLDGAGKTSIM